MPRLPKANERRTTRPPKNPKKSAATRAAVTAGVVTFSACIICPRLIPLAMAGGAAYLAYRLGRKACSYFRAMEIQSAP